MLDVGYIISEVVGKSVTINKSSSSATIRTAGGFWVQNLATLPFGPLKRHSNKGVMVNLNVGQRKKFKSWRFER